MTSAPAITGLGWIRGRARRDGALWVDDEDLAILDARPQARRMSRVSKFALAAALQAMENGGWKTDREPQDNMGVLCASTHMSTSFGHEFHKGFIGKGKPTAGPIHFTNGCLNTVGSHISLELVLTGFNHTLVAQGAEILDCLLGGFNAGLQAAGTAVKMMQEGPCRAMLCVAAEEMSDILIDIYRRFRLLPPMAAGEGAVALLIEAPPYARPPLARIGKTWSGHGPGIRQDASGAGIERAVRNVCDPEKINGYSGCANGTDLDAIEANAVERLFPRIEKCLSKKEAGEGFAYTSLLQIAAPILQGRTGSFVAASYDRLGDVSAVSFEVTRRSEG